MTKVTTDEQIINRMAARTAALDVVRTYNLMAHYGTDGTDRRATVKTVRGTFWEAVAALEAHLERYNGGRPATERLAREGTTYDLVAAGRTYGHYDMHGVAY